MDLSLFLIEDGLVNGVVGLGDGPLEEGDGVFEVTGDHRLRSDYKLGPN